MTLQELTNAINAICPIYGISVDGELLANDKSKWELLFKPESTDDQKQAAINFINLETTIIK